MNRFIRISIYILIAVVALFFLTYQFLYIYKEKRNALAEYMIKEAIKEINDFQNKNGRYPENLMELSIFEKNKRKVLFVLPSSKLYYHRVDNNYQISYHIFPFGPFHVYDKKNDEWSYEE